MLQDCRPNQFKSSDPSTPPSCEDASKCKQDISAYSTMKALSHVIEML